MNSKVKKTAAIGLFLIAACIGGFQLIQWLGNDPDLLPGESAGMIAAVEYLPQASKIVVFKPDGTTFEMPHKEGARDKDPIWREDGQRLYFLSNRDENTFHIYRWRPGDGDASRRSVGAAARSNPAFGPTGDPKANTTALITSRGLIMEYDPKTGSTFQVVPPRKAIGSEAGNESRDARFSGAYANLGRAFEKARWAGNRRWIVATVQRSIGVVLILQDTQIQGEGDKAQMPPPMPIVAGDSIDFDVSPDGTVVMSVRGFRWFLPEYDESSVPQEVLNQFIPEQFRKDGKITVPYMNGVMAFNPSQERSPGILFASPDDTTAFGAPAISPDGKGVAIPFGKRAGEQFIAEDLRFYPMGGNPQTDVRVIAPDEVVSACWMADSQTVVYAKLVADKHEVWKVGASGGEPVRVSPEGRDIGSPTVSPQTPKAASK